jgi:uncharacterized phage infection (PIP) family protein YhgE
MTFVEKVLAYAKGGDEAKVVKFQSDVSKYLKKQIKEIKDETDELNDQLEDATNELNEAVVNVDLDRIQTTDARKGYVVSYVDLLESKEEQIRQFKSRIKENNKLLELREAQLKLLQ